MSSFRALAFAGMWAAVWFFPPRGAGQVPSGPLPPGVYRIGGGVSAPVPIFKPDPEYPEEARAAKLEGVVLLQVVIDESGISKEIKVVRSLGLGLDQRAVEAVQQWRFKPALLNGKPVAVSATIEVTFRPAK